MLASRKLKLSFSVFFKYAKSFVEAKEDSTNKGKERENVSFEGKSSKRNK